MKTKTQKFKVGQKVAYRDSDEVYCIYDINQNGRLAIEDMVTGISYDMVDPEDVMVCPDWEEKIAFDVYCNVVDLLEGQVVSLNRVAKRLLKKKLLKRLRYKL